MIACQSCGRLLDNQDAIASTCPICLLQFALLPDREAGLEDSFGQYEPMCLLGAGGSAEVYLAMQQRPIQREVALKVLKAGLDEPELRARFEAESRVLGLLNHPFIAQVYDTGTSRHGRPYIVMQLVEGEPLTAYCDQRQLTLRQRLELFIEVCNAVEYAHRKGVLHRDLKPANILVTEENGRPAPRLIDFGIAKALVPPMGVSDRQTEFGRVLATPEYMSPEAVGWDERRVSPASDTYSLGVVLFEMLTGALPFDPDRLRAHGLGEAMRIVREEEPPLLTDRLPHAGRRSISAMLAAERLNAGDLAAVVRRCLQKQTAARYASAAEIAQDLKHVLCGESVGAPHVTRQALRFLRQSRRLWWLAAAAGMASLLVAAMFLWGGSAAHNRAALLDSAQLTAYEGTETSASFSPDARTIAFAWDGESGDNWDIYRLAIGDSAPVRLTRSPAIEYSPAWSPDGTSIAFLRAESAHTASIVLLPVQGGPERVLRTAELNIEQRKRWLTWSPDGRYLLLAHRQEMGQRAVIYAVDAQSGAEHAVTNHVGRPADEDGQPSLAHGDRTLFFARDAETPGQIWSVTVNSDLRPVGPAKRIVLPGLESVECSVPQRLSANELLFSAPVRYVRTLWRGRLDGSSPPSQISELPGPAAAPEISADQTKLVYARDQYDSNVWRLKLDGPAGSETGRQRVLNSTVWDQNAALSPDGSALAFESNRTGFPEIWRAESDGTDPRQLSHMNVLTSSPMWSPDGSQIAFHAAVNGQNDVFIMSASGGALRNLSHHPSEDIQPVWSPDGHWIYFCSNRSGRRELWRLRPAATSDSAAEQVTRDGGFDVAFSPDGHWLYYSRVRATTADIWRRLALGGPEEIVLEGAIGGHVAVASSGMYASRPSKTVKGWEIVFRSSSQGEVKVLASIPKQVKDRLAVSKDERTIYYTQYDTSGADLLLVPNLH